jgi:predicted O-methyltransferase YrrM
VDSKIVPEMSHPTSVCPHPEQWHAIDDMASELEVLDMLYALVVLLKPKVVVETGCYRGHATYALATGINHNGFGVLSSCDVSHEQVAATRQRLEDANLGGRVSQESGVDLINSLESVDFAFLDSGMDTPRIDELRALYPKLSPGGVVAIHDSGIQFGLREFHLGKTLRELNMQHIFFDTPRGLCLCRKMPEIYP